MANAVATFKAGVRTDPQQRLLASSFGGLAAVLVAIGVSVAFTLQFRIERQTESAAGALMANAIRGHLEQRDVAGTRLAAGPPVTDTAWWQRLRTELTTMLEAQDVDVLDKQGVVVLGDQPAERGSRSIPAGKLRLVQDGESVEYIQARPAEPRGRAFVVTVPVAFVSASGRVGLGAVSVELGAGPLLGAARDARNLALVTTAGVLALLLATLWFLMRRLTQRAFRDPLTDLPNRRYFADAASGVLAHHERHGRSSALLYADINRFGTVNATLGQRAGDAVLRSVAGVLARRIRAGDILARIGGDDFALLLVEASSEEARLVADTIATTVETATALDVQRLRISLSIGIAAYPDHGHGVDELLQHAETAMQEAKAHQVPYVVFSPSDPCATSEQLGLEADLRDAIDNDELDVHYQPIVASSDSSIVAYEALARWSRQGRSISPAVFIPMAERTGLVRHLDRLVYRRAVRSLAEGYLRDPAVRVAVNLSAASLNDPTLTAFLNDVAERQGVAPNRLTLEVTESATLESLERATATLRALRELGFKVALDDFGTGYSSLAYLRSLPIDTVKIDRQFVQGVGRHPSDETLVQAIIRYSRSLHIRVVAEGVESDEQHHWLRGQGVDFEQGYLHGRPAPLTHLPPRATVRAQRGTDLRSL